MMSKSTFSTLTASPLFSSALYFSHLANPVTGPGRELWFAPQLSSTQTHLIASNVSGEAGVVCVAARQTSGRGRGDNTWESPPGCLMFSFRHNYEHDGSRLPFMQYLVSLAMVRAVRKATSLDVRIKWPNDLYSNEPAPRKIGGILCQSHYADSRFTVTTGVGLNVSNPQPTTCLADLAKRSVSPEIVLAEFFNAFDLLYNRVFLTTQGPSFAPLLPEYHANWLHTNQPVTANQGQLSLLIEGISPDTGCLLARDPGTGLVHELTPDGNRLDFFSGLVSSRRKHEDN